MGQHLSVMIVGSGAREHTISRAYEKSSQAGRIIVAPGNDFIGYDREKEFVIDKGCSLNYPQSILDIARKYMPDLIDVAQDDALAAGTVDLLQKHGFQVFGATRDAAKIEWDKKWSREFMQRHKIPSPDFRYFDSFEPAAEYVKYLYSDEPEKLIYVKAAGLCGGKGALKSTSLKEAVENIKRMKSFSDAGEVFLVEEGLQGEEFSYYAMCDGQTHHIFKSAQDNKTLLNFDEGDQTGGMGAICPAKITEPFSDEIEEQFISRVITGMAAENIPYKGVLYLGGIVADGRPMNIEYNARWGDPECQVVLPSLETDYIDVVTACIEGRLDEINIKQDDKARVCVVGASRGYPNDYSSAKGKRIYGLEDVKDMKEITVFGAGVEVRDGKFYANGGRLFSIVAEGGNILDARQKAYDAMSHVNIEGNNLHYRTDIGWRDVERYLEEI
ncbi:MAG: phosphoribosylamine--glycine ligase [archaeon]|nr:phosphoribosylamine--glycine ligase [archaeon]